MTRSPTNCARFTTKCKRTWKSIILNANEKFISVTFFKLHLIIFRQHIFHENKLYRGKTILLCWQISSYSIWNIKTIPKLIFEYNYWNSRKTSHFPSVSFIQSHKFPPKKSRIFLEFDWIYFNSLDLHFFKHSNMILFST